MHTIMVYRCIFIGRFESDCFLSSWRHMPGWKDPAYISEHFCYLRFLDKVFALTLLLGFFDSSSVSFHFSFFFSSQMGHTRSLGLICQRCL